MPKIDWNDVDSYEEEIFREKIQKKVKTGDTLVILEAMKMEHSIKASEDGTVTQLLISVNDQVENGALLMIVE